MTNITQLARLFASYKIYPKELYTNSTPVRVFQRRYPNNYYSKQLEGFLNEHNYAPVQRGADLPWWGSAYFSDAIGNRVCIISQDSASTDAGSIVFFANLIPVCYSMLEYEKYLSSLDANQSFKYSSWRRIKELLERWKIDYKYLYITDAAKVYKRGSRKDFDKQKSRELLEREIRLCAPDLLIILGNAGLSLLSDIKYSDAIDMKVPISVLGIPTIVCPFLIGQGLRQPKFKQRIQIATEKILNYSINAEDFTRISSPFKRQSQPDQIRLNHCQVNNSMTGHTITDNHSTLERMEPFNKYQRQAIDAELPDNYFLSVVALAKEILGKGFSPKENKSGSTFYGYKGTRILKVINTIKSATVEFNAPVPQVPGLKVLSEAEARKKKMGACRWVYKGTDIKTIEQLIREAVKNY